MGRWNAISDYVYKKLEIGGASLDGRFNEEGRIITLLFNTSPTWPEILVTFDLGC